MNWAYYVAFAIVFAPFALVFLYLMGLTVQAMIHWLGYTKTFLLLLSIGIWASALFYLLGNKIPH